MSIENSMVSQARVFHDFKGLNELKGLANSDNLDDKKTAAKEASTQFESFFLSMMLKSMRQANMAMSDENSAFNSQGTQFYQSMFDQQVSTSLAQNSPLNLADLMVKQVGMADKVAAPTVTPTNK
ncbi:MAG: rod-binding protein [Sinobacterium sp.]|nr:rod-binding protein [Sinobacterium sp.]